MERVTENDLLALIEGELPDERRPLVEAALRSDPALLRRVVAMKADREGLVEVGRGDRAPAGLVDRASAIAARASAVQVDTGGPVRHATARTRRLQMAAAAVVIVGGLGVWGWLMATMTSSREGGGVLPDPQVALASGGGEASEDDMAAVGPVSPGLEVIDEHALPLDAVLDESDAASDALLAEFLAGFEEDGASAVSEPAMDYMEAARLALDGRLRLEMRGEGPAGMAIAADSEAASQVGAFGMLRSESGVGGESSWRVELRYRTGGGEEELASELARAIERIEAVTGRRVRLVEASGSDTGATPVASLDAAGVLWWGQPASGWTRRMVVRPRVSFVGE